MPEKFISSPIFVSMEDTNLEGNVYWTKFLSWFGHVREQFLLALIPDFQEKFVAGFRIITSEETMKHLSPAFFGDLIIVEISVLKIEHCRVTLGFEINNPGANRKLAKGSQVLVFANSDGKPTTIPNNVKEEGLKYLVQ